jgi:4-diphosphocytidyl-2-methyl-D-erithritol synthase
MLYTIICAGGTGTRFGGDTPKQFIDIRNAPMLLHSIRAFAQFGTIIVGANPEYFSKIKTLAPAVHTTIAGRDRNCTIKNALDYIAENLSPNDTDIILTHDAARPHITAELINRVLAAAEKHGAASPAIPAADTILVADIDHFVTAVPDRTALYGAQTPQGATFEIMQKLYADDAQSTDLCGLCTQKNIPVKIIPGDIENIKITYKQDLPT